MSFTLVACIHPDDDIDRTIEAARKALQASHG
jgi:hypothetical protein